MQLGSEELGVTEVLGSCAVSLLLCYVIYNWIKARNYPPGPLGLPIIGYVPFLGEFQSGTLWKLSKKYGDIFSFYVGPRRIICVNDYQMVKEILSNPLTLARPTGGFDFVTGKAGFGGMNGWEWQEQRRFVMSAMKSLGMGKGPWELLTQECSSDLVKEIQSKKGRPFSCEDVLSLSIINSLLSLLFGRRLDPVKEKDSVEITNTFTNSFVDHMGSLDVAVNNPSLVKVAEFLKLKEYQNFMHLLLKFEAIFEKEVNERTASKEKCSRDDLIGYYLQEIEKRKNTNKPHTFSLEYLRGNMFSLILTGRDSTVLSMNWLLLLMANYPSVQEKICEEIDRVLGRDGAVYYDDRIHLPYTTATLYEMLRFISIVPLLPPRLVLRDFEFGGYIIPKDSHIVGNYWALFHDPRYFEDPMAFKPERFLLENETKLKTMDNNGLFSFGKRNCPGEGVAMMNMYLYFVSIMQKFNIKTPHGGPPDMNHKKCNAGIIPKPQDLCFIER